MLESLPGKTIILGVLDLPAEVESPDAVADRIRRACRTCRPSGWSSRRTAGSSTCRARSPSARCRPWWKAQPSSVAAWAPESVPPGRTGTGGCNPRRLTAQQSSLVAVSGAFG